MALEEKSVVDKIEVLLAGQIQVRRRDQILKDGVEVAATYHRHVLSPGDELTNEDHFSVVGEVSWWLMKRVFIPSFFLYKLL